METYKGKCKYIFLEGIGVQQTQNTDVELKKESKCESKDWNEDFVMEELGTPIDENGTNQKDTDVSPMENTDAGNVSGRKNVIKIDDMLSDNYLAEKFHDTGDSLMEVIKCLDGDREALLMRLEEQKATIMALAEKDIKKIRMISELEESLSTLQKRFDNLSEDKFKIEDQLEQQKTAYEGERRRLAGEMDKIAKSHKVELKNERKRMESQIAKKDKDIELEITKLQDEISKTKGENAKQSAIAENLKKQLHTMRQETEQQLQETYRCQENEYKAFRSEIKEQEDKLQLLNYKLNQTKQEKESYFQQVQVLTAEKEDLLLRENAGSTLDEKGTKKREDTYVRSKEKPAAGHIACKTDGLRFKSQIEAFADEKQKLVQEMVEKTNIHKVELNNERKRAKAEIETKDKNIKRQKEEIGEKEKNINNLKKELSNIKSEKKEVEKQNTKAEEDKKRYSHEIQKKSEQLSRANDDNIILRKKIDEAHDYQNRLFFELRQTTETYEAKISSLKTEIQQLESEKKGLLLRAKAEIETKDKHIKRQKEEIGEKEKNINNLKKELSNIKSEKKEVEKQNTKAEEDKKRYSHEIQKKSEQLSRANDDNIILRKKIDEAHDYQNRLFFELRQTTETYEAKISSLKTEIQQLESEKKGLLLRAKAEIETKDKNIKRQKEEIGEKEKNINNLRKEFSNIKSEKKEVEKQNTKAEEDKKRYSHEIQKKSEQLSRANDDNIILRKKIDEAHDYQNRLFFELRQTTETYEAKISSLKTEIQQLESEKKGLLLRSESTVSMTYNNPNIADLSGEKRPTKLAEDFAELYDNEWTDAFEQIEGENEEDKLTFMLELLRRANQHCQDLSNGHTKKVKQSLSTLTLLMPNKQEQKRSGGSLVKYKLRQGKQEQIFPEKQKLESDFEKLQTEQKKTILEATKFFETLLSKDVEKAVMEVIVNEKGIDDEKQKCVVAYIAKCIDICWSMIRHKPPVHVDLPDMTCDIPFDTNKYKPYTKTGKHLAYIVWPALYLHEGGPLLSKGVAQGK